MKLYRHKDLNFQFIVLNPDNEPSKLRTTVASIKKCYGGIKYSCVCEEKARKEDIDEMSKICTTYVGGKTITSLINAGLVNGGTEWHLIIMAGTWVRNGLDRKYALFVEDVNDILFPIVDRKMNFIDGTINGIFLHRQAFDLTGPFSDDPSLEKSKAVWSSTAVEKGCTFKAILGAQIC